MDPYENLKEDINQKTMEAGGGLLRSIKDRKGKKGNYSVLVEFLAVVAVFVFYTSARGESKSLYSFACTTVTAEVVETGTVKYNGSDGDLGRLRYYVVFKYVYNSREYRKRLLFESMPDYGCGDKCRLKISRINPEEVFLND